MNACISSSYYQPTISSVIYRLWSFSKLVQRKVVTLDLVPGDKAPLSKDDGVAVRLPERQRVAAENILFQDEPHRLPAQICPQPASCWRCRPRSTRRRAGRGT